MIELPLMQFWLGVLALVIAGLGATIGAVWTISNKIRDIETSTDKKLKEARDHCEQQLKQAQDEGDAKRARMYARFDDYKKHLESNFVRRESCGLMHSEMARAIDKMATELGAVKIELVELKGAVIKLQAERLYGGGEGRP